MATPKLVWDVGTGYDLFTSLEVLHDPGRYGLRGSWAAGVRSRLPAESREFLQELMDGHFWMLPWLATLEGQKDAAAVLKKISQIPPAERLVEFTTCTQLDSAREILLDVKERGEWDDLDKEKLLEVYKAYLDKEGKKKKISDEDLTRDLDKWANSEEFGNNFLEAIQTYYEVFFAEDEKRIRSALETAVKQAKQMAEKLEFRELLEELSQGLRFDYKEFNKLNEVRMIPSFWTTPLTLFTPLNENESNTWIFMFGARPANASLVPGDPVPELLYQTLKALADPTRLRIMRYLSEEPSTPAELARRLRLRAPTVLHHLDALRLARLVHVTLSYEGRRYEARREAVELACNMLYDFLQTE